MNDDLMIEGAEPCVTCCEMAAEHFETTPTELSTDDLSWYCYMFGCGDCAREGHTCGMTRPGLGGHNHGIAHEHTWLDRPESDTRECLICGEEVSG